jgi:hypothetical protein
MLASKDVSPQEASQRCTECCTEGSVVDTYGHGVYGCPESAVADGYTVVDVDLLPSLDNSGEQDGRADVCACELCFCRSVKYPSTLLGRTGYVRYRGLRRGSPCLLSRQWYRSW